MKLTKAIIVEKVSNRVDLGINQSATIVESLIEAIKSTLESGEDVLISGFGKFCVKEKSERKGRNPATGEIAILTARRVVTFKCSTNLRNKLNSKRNRRMKPYL